MQVCQKKKGVLTLDTEKKYRNNRGRGKKNAQRRDQKTDRQRKKMKKPVPEGGPGATRNPPGKGDGSKKKGDGKFEIGILSAIRPD